MDRLSFVFSLLLIVSITTITFGYVIKAKNSNGESLEKPQSDPDLFPYVTRKEFGAFLKRFHHQSNSDMKTDAQAKLQERKRVNLEDWVHTIHIEVENLSGYDFKYGTIAVGEGKSTQPPPSSVLNGTTMTLDVSNSIGPVAGVLVYYIDETAESLAILFKVSDFLHLWNLKTFPGKLNANAQVYDKMIHDAIPADYQPYADHVDSLHYEVVMSSFNKASLTTRITPYKT